MTEDELKKQIIQQVEKNNQLKIEINELISEINEHKKSIEEANRIIKSLK